MSVQDDVKKVVKNINNIYKRREAAVFAISLNYSAIALNYFRQVQSADGFWTNRTRQALDRMFSNAFIESNSVGWFMAHGIDYGVYLELANDRKNEAIRPTIQRFAGRFLNAVKGLYKD